MLNSQMKTEVMPPILGQPDENRGHAPIQCKKMNPRESIDNFCIKM